MKINQVLVESAGATVAFAFGRFNPAHQGHVEVWRAVEDAGANWFIGTNSSTLGPNDPLIFEQKSAWMEEIYPPITGHIVSEQSVLTLAAYIFKKTRKTERATVAYITDAADWAWSGKLLNQYNGVEGAHGYYKFAQITHVPSPRVSSATALRDAARADDKVAFYHASGTDPKSKVAGLTYFDTVKQAVEKYPLPVKKAKKVKEHDVSESLAQNRNLSPITKKYIQDHNWKLTKVNPMSLDTDGFDDPFNRVIDIDTDHPVNFKDPIIVHANGATIIDGFHRVYQAQLQGLKQIPAYVPIEQRVAEDAKTTEHYNGIEISMEKEDDEIMVKAMMSGGRELGHVLFVIDGEYLAPQDLEVDERYQGQGIAATMYDYVKSKGYKIRRSGQQTDAGAGFWDKHKPGKNVWEQGVAESSGQKTFTVVYYSKKTDRNVTKNIKANNESQVWDQLKLKGIDVVSVKEQGLNEFALPGGGDGDSGRWYTDDELADIIGDDWFEDFDVSHDEFNIDAYGEKAKKNLAGYANSWFDDKGYNVNVMGVDHNDVDHDLKWYIVGSFQNDNFADKDVEESNSAVIASTADRLSNKDDGRTAKLRAAGDARREQHLKGRDIAKNDRSSKDAWGNLKEAPGDFGLGANYRAVPDDEMQALMGRSKNKQKTKRDKFDYPYIHGSNIEVKDEEVENILTLENLIELIKVKQNK